MWRVYFARLLLLVAALVGVVLLIGTLLPRTFRVEQSIAIAAPRGHVYAQIADLRQWLKWSPWSHVADNADVRPDPGGGTAGALHWRDPRGDGKLWLVSVDPEQAVDYRMTLARFREVRGRIELSGEGPTHVRWTFEGRLPAGPFYGYFRIFFHAEMREQLARSLDRLRAIVEPPAAGSQ